MQTVCVWIWSGGAATRPALIRRASKLPGAHFDAVPSPKDNPRQINPTNMRKLLQTANCTNLSATARVGDFDNEKPALASPNQLEMLRNLHSLSGTDG